MRVLPLFWPVFLFSEKAAGGAFVISRWSVSFFIFPYSPPLSLALRFYKGYMPTYMYNHNITVIKVVPGIIAKFLIYYTCQLLLQLWWAFQISATNFDAWRSVWIRRCWVTMSMMVVQRRLRANVHFFTTLFSSSAQNHCPLETTPNWPHIRSTELLSVFKLLHNTSNGEHSSVGLGEHRNARQSTERHPSCT